MSLPCSTGQASTHGRCLLDRPVKPGDDTEVLSTERKGSGSTIPHALAPDPPGVGEDGVAQAQGRMDGLSASDYCHLASAPSASRDIEVMGVQSDEERRSCLAESG
jgi:hypothetical protein